MGDVPQRRIRSKRLIPRDDFREIGAEAPWTSWICAGTLPTEAWASSGDPQTVARMSGAKCGNSARRVGEDVTTLTPHRPGRADFPHPVPHGRASLTVA